MKGLIIAIQFLTRLPTPRIEVTSAGFIASMRWFPAAGALIGLVVAAAAWAGAMIDNWTGALVALAAWVLVTGALHLDGLADVADARGAAHKDRDRMLAVLADPHVGSFGVTAIGLQLIAKLVLLHAVVDLGRFVALACVPFVARVAPLFWSRLITPLHEGLGARFRGAIRPVHLVAWSMVLICAAWFVPALLVFIPCVALWGLWVDRRLGGISGDAHGAGIELVETVLLFAIVAQAAL